MVQELEKKYRNKALYPILINKAKQYQSLRKQDKRLLVSVSKSMVGIH